MKDAYQSFDSKSPRVERGVYVAPGARVIGDVDLCEGASVWHNAVLRGDEAPITVGKGSNVQDNCTLHCDAGKPLVLGENVTVGHNAVLHSCTVGNGSLIGMGAIVLNDVKIGNNCLIAAGALLTPRTEVPDNSMVMGSPATVRRPLTAQEIAGMHENAVCYAALAGKYGSAETAEG